MTYSSEEAKKLICECGKRLYERGYVAGNEGNISCRISENEIYITPTMESKGYLTPEMLLKMDLEGNILEGTYKPSSESKMHLGLYRANPQTGAIVHAHPTALTAYACRNEPLLTSYLPEIVAVFGKEIPITEFAIPGTEDVPNSILPYAQKGRAVMIRNHGAITFAPTLKAALFYMETVEQYARTYMNMQLIGNCHPMEDAIVEALVDYHESIVERERGL